MTCFKDSREVEQVIGGFLQAFPRLEPLLREVISHKRMILKLELSDPDLNAEIDFTKSPLEVRLNATGDGTVAMTISSDHFHQLLLGLLPIGVGVNHRKLILRGSTANYALALPLFYVAPSIYPFYLEAIGRSDLVAPGDRPLLHGEKISEDTMTRIVSALAFLVGFSLGFLKKHLAKKLDIIAALEAMGKGLSRATNS